MQASYQGQMPESLPIVLVLSIEGGGQQTSKPKSQPASTPQPYARKPAAKGSAAGAEALGILIDEQLTFAYLVKSHGPKLVDMDLNAIEDLLTARGHRPKSHPS